MSRSTGLPQHLLVVDLRPERAERIIGYARQAGLAVRTTRAESLEQALRQAEAAPPDLVIVSHDGPADWDFDEAMMGFAKIGCHPLVVADKLDDVVVARAYGLGCQGVLPSASSDALVSAMRWCLSVCADRRALAKAEAIQAETAVREESLLDLSRDPVAYIHEGMHIRANHAYLEFFGIDDADEIDSLPFLDLVAQEDAAQAKVCLKAASRGDIPADGVPLSLVSANDGPQKVRVEITKAAYEGEPCLQLTLRVPATPAPAASAPLPDTSPAQAGISEVGAWWDRVQAIQDTSPSAALVLLAMANPSDSFSDIPVIARAPMLDATVNAVWEVLSETVGSSVDRRALVDLGAGMFGVLIPSADAEQAREHVVRFHEKVASLEVVRVEHRLAPSFLASGVAIGTTIGWADLSEAMVALENNLLLARKSNTLAWFDPSTTGRDLLRRRREMTESLRQACATADGVRLRYRPIMPLASEPLTLYAISTCLRDSDGQWHPLSHFEEVISEPGLAAMVDVATARACAAAIQAKPSRNHLKLFIPISSQTLREDEAIAQVAAELRQVSTHAVAAIDEATIRARPDRARVFAQAMSKAGLEVCVDQFGAMPADAITLVEQTRPAWVRLAPTWNGEVLRQPQEQKSFRTLIAASHAASARTVASGVQDTQSMSALFSAGVGYAQGDFLSPELPGMEADFGV